MTKLVNPRLKSPESSEERFRSMTEEEMELELDEIELLDSKEEQDKS